MMMGMVMVDGDGDNSEEDDEWMRIMMLET